MRISDWSSDVCSSDLRPAGQADDYSGGRIEKVNLETGEIVRLYEKGENGPLKAPNDLVFDRTGGFWFTDTGAGRHRDMDRGGIFYARSEEHTSELQSLMRISYAVFCLKKKKQKIRQYSEHRMPSPDYNNITDKYSH